MYLASAQTQPIYRIQDVKEKSIYSRFKFYIFPFAALVLTIAMIFGQIVPSLQSLSDRQSELSRQKSRTDKISQQLTQIKSYISSNNVNISYIKSSIAKFLPEYAGEAVTLQNQVSNLSASNGLNMSKFKTGEQIASLDDYKTFDKVDPLKFRSYPTEITLDGSLSGISSLFNSIYRNDPLFIVNKFDLKRSSLSNDSWNLNLIFTQYSFRSENSVNATGQIADYVNYQFDTKYLDYFRLKQQ